MKITLNKKQILEILKTFSKTNVKEYPIAGEVCFEVSDNVLTICNTDRDITIKHVITIDSPAPNITFVINAKNFLDIVKSINETFFDIEINYDNVKVAGCFLKIIEEHKVSKDSDRLKKDFWNLHEHLLKFRYCNGTAPQFIATIQANDFIDALEEVVDYTDTYDHRRFLHGVAIQFINDKLNIAATSGSFMANVIFDNANTVASKNYNDQIFILPKHFCKQLITCKNILKTDRIRLNLFGNHIFIEHDKLNLTSRFIEEEFISYKKIIPNDTSHYLKLNVKNFLDIVKMASKVNNNCKHNKINLQIKENTLMITKTEQENILFNMPLNILEHNIEDNFLIFFNNYQLLQLLKTYQNFIDDSEIVINFNYYNYLSKKLDLIMIKNKKIIILLMPLLY